MKDLFTNLYNKVLNFFHQTENKEATKNVACNRLKLVLMQDRTNLSPAIMERMRKELIDLLSKYLELDRDLLELNFEHEDEQMALMLSIPVLRAKDEDEIQEILRKEDEAKMAEEESEEESEETEPEDELETEEDSEKVVDEDEETENDEEESEVVDKSETFETDEISEKSKTEVKEEITSKK